MDGGRTARINISTTLLAEESPSAVHIPEAHEEVSSVVVLRQSPISIIALFLPNDTRHRFVCCVQLCKDAVEGRAGTTGCCERYPGELADGCGGFLGWRRVFGVGGVDCFGYEGFCFGFHGCWG